MHTVVEPKDLVVADMRRQSRDKHKGSIEQLCGAACVHLDATGAEFVKASNRVGKDVDALAEAVAD